MYTCIFKHVFRIKYIDGRQIKGVTKCRLLNLLAGLNGQDKQFLHKKLYLETKQPATVKQRYAKKVNNKSYEKKKLWLHHPNEIGHCLNVNAWSLEPMTRSYDLNWSESFKNNKLMLKI